LDPRADHPPDPELVRFALPVSGLTVALRPPTGSDDLLLAEAPRTAGGDAALALALAGRLVRAVDGPPPNWGGLSVTDLDALILRLRQQLVGDRVLADLPCPAEGCGERIDIAFSIDEFLAHQAPRRDPSGEFEPADEPGWFRLAGGEVRAAPGGCEPPPVRFRLPSADDLVAATSSSSVEEDLIRRCIRPLGLPPEVQERVESAMEALAPSLACDLEGVCPECASAVRVPFDARWFCLCELRDRASYVYEDVDVLARRYHWTEAAILAMPQGRRFAYAELARRAEGA
jgi:hypothetical protein